MLAKNKPSIGIVGAGNLAHHLALLLFKGGLNIQFICNRGQKEGEDLAKMVNSKWYPSTTKELKADIIFLSVVDDAYQTLTKKHYFKGTIVHTAGSVSMDVFPKQYPNTGVFYPLQTFSKYKNVQWDLIPVFIEFSNQQVQQTLIDLCTHLKLQCFQADSMQRKTMHLAAVFACNFTNHMLCIAEEIMTKNKLSFQHLHPLIKETLEKSLAVGPKNAQTGPAKRKDLKTQQRHIKMLQNTDHQKIYTLVSNHISGKYEH